MAHCLDKAKGDQLDSISEKHEGTTGIEKIFLPRIILPKRRRRQLKVHQTPEHREKTITKDEKSASMKQEVVQPDSMKPEVEKPVSMQREIVKTVSTKLGTINPLSRTEDVKTVSLKPKVLKADNLIPEAVRPVAKKQATVKTSLMKSTTSSPLPVKAEFIKPVRASSKNTRKKREQNRRLRTDRVHLVEYRPEMKREELFEFNRSFFQKLIPSSVTKGKKSKQIVNLQSSSVADGGMTDKNNEKAEITRSDNIHSGMESSGTYYELENVATLHQSAERFTETRKPNIDKKGKISRSLCKLTKATPVGKGNSCEVGQKNRSFGSFRQFCVKYSQKKGSVFSGKESQFKRSSNLQKKRKQNSGRHTYKVRHRIVACKIKPRDIRFTKTQIPTKFAGINKTVHDTLHELKAGLITVEDIPKIIVFRSRGKNYTINNKRLLVFNQISTYYRKCFAIDLVIPVLFHESLNRVKVSRTFECAPEDISEMNITEKKKSAQSSKKLYVRSKKGHTQKCVPGEKFRMKKADIRRCRNGDDDFELCSVAKSEFDCLSSDFKDTREYMSTSDRGEPTKRVPDIGSLKVISGLSAKSRKNRAKSYGVSSSKIFLELGEYIETSIGDKMREATKRSNYNEQYSRKNNVKVMGVEEDENETIETLTKSVTDIFQSQDVTLQENDIVAIQRVPTKRDSTRPVLLKLKSNNCKSAIMRKRTVMKNAGHCLVDDVTRLNQELISRLSRHSKIQRAWYFNGKVFGLSRFDERVCFDIYDNINCVISEHRLKHGDPQIA